MNTLSIQLPSAANAAADSASKGRAAGSDDGETSFRDVLKGEVAERRQAEADASAAVGKGEKTASKSRSDKTAESAEAGQKKDETERAAAIPEDMAQFLALTSQFAQSSADPDAESVSAAGETASGVPAIAVKADASAGALPAASSQPVSAASDPPKLGMAPAADSPAGAESPDFAAEFEQAGLAQQPAAGASPEKGAQIGGASAGALAAAAQAAEAGSARASQPAVQAAEADSALESKPASLIALQQAGIEQAERVSEPAADRIAPRIATPAWNQAIGQKVVWMASNDQHSASLSLNPPDLGPLQVVIRVSESTATANFVSAHPEVRQALEAALPRLREMLGEAGIQLGQAHVGAGTSGEYGAGAQQPQPIPNTVETSYSLQPDVPEPARIVRRGLVDTFA